MPSPAIDTPLKHWCEFEFIAKTVKNPNIHIKGHYSYYSAYWDQGFERCVVRYLHDKPSTTDKPIDQLHIGNFVCFGAECVIMMGGNQLHRLDWIFTFPFDTRSFLAAGDTIISDGCWIIIFLGNCFRRWKIKPKVDDKNKIGNYRQCINIKSIRFRPQSSDEIGINHHIKQRIDNL